MKVGKTKQAGKVKMSIFVPEETARLLRVKAVQNDMTMSEFLGKAGTIVKLEDLKEIASSEARARKQETINV